MNNSKNVYDTNDAIFDTQLEISQLSQESGFELTGFTEAKIGTKDQDNIQSFIDQKYFGSMSWFPERQNIRIHFENLGFLPASCIVLGLIYKPTDEIESNCVHISKSVSRYAWGKDYHQVLKKKAKPILKYLREKFPEYKFRQSVDSLPIPEKILARNAGLGWIGKNTLLIHPDFGSYFFLSVILSELALHNPNSNLENIDFINYSKDRCGTCRACLDACPTKAIVQPYQLDSNLCISHNTIELKVENIKSTSKNHGWIYGCDICQEVCPWNKTVSRKKKIHTKVNEFNPIDFFAKTTIEFTHLENSEFDNHFHDSAILRIGVAKWNENIDTK